MAQSSAARKTDATTTSQAKKSEQYKVINPVRSEAGSDNMIVQPEPADPNERPPWE